MSKRSADEAQLASPAGTEKRQKKLSDFFLVKPAEPRTSEGPGASPRSRLNSVLLQHLTDPEWRRKVTGEFRKPYFLQIEAFLEEQRGKGVEVYPPRPLIFNAFNLTPFSRVRVVILGQDPYHGPGQAHGLCFSVPRGVSQPPSLQNIFKELSEDIDGFRPPPHGCLEKWAKEGVFLLNAALTVEARKANSHATIGWQQFTDHVIRFLSSYREHLVFMLWGGWAAKKEKLIDSSKHLVLKTAHPSPLSADRWFGCRCFSKANAQLKAWGEGEVDWRLD